MMLAISNFYIKLYNLSTRSLYIRDLPRIYVLSPTFTNNESQGQRVAWDIDVPGAFSEERWSSQCSTAVKKIGYYADVSYDRPVLMFSYLVCELFLLHHYMRDSNHWHGLSLHSSFYYTWCRTRCQEITISRYCITLESDVIDFESIKNRILNEL